MQQGQGESGVQEEEITNANCHTLGAGLGVCVLLCDTIKLQVFSKGSNRDRESGGITNASSLTQREACAVPVWH